MISSSRIVYNSKLLGGHKSLDILYRKRRNIFEQNYINVIVTLEGE